MALIISIAVCPVFGKLQLEIFDNTNGSSFKMFQAWCNKLKHRHCPMQAKQQWLLFGRSPFWPARPEKEQLLRERETQNLPEWFTEFVQCSRFSHSHRAGLGLFPHCTDCLSSALLKQTLQSWNQELNRCYFFRSEMVGTVHDCPQTIGSKGNTEFLRGPGFYLFN